MTYEHNCIEEKCTPEQCYGLSEMGLCLVCGGCGDWSCCQHDDECFPPNVQLLAKYTKCMV